MKVYFVRHGQTEQGAQNLHQHTEDPLSEDGLEQAGKVAQRFRTIKIDAIYTSPNTRTLQTAEQIKAITGVPLTTDERLREIRLPSFIVGRKIDDPDVRAAKDEMLERRNDPDWHHSDEENFAEARDRVKEFIRILDREMRDVAVVSHARTLKMFFAVMLFGEAAAVDLYERIYRGLRITMTGITVFEKGSRGWLLMTWNDYAHLGEDVGEDFYK